MKIRCVVFVVVTVFLIVVAQTVTVSASDYSFSIEEMPQEEKNSFLSKATIQLLDNDIQKYSITNFDVNIYGTTAIGASNGTDRYVYLYDSNGIFVCGYKFSTEGDFAVKINDNNSIAIYYVRSDILRIIDINGETLELYSVPPTVENTNYWTYDIGSRTKVISGNEYKLEGRNLSSSYAKLTMTDSDGYKTVIYDVGTVHYLKVLFILFFLIVLSVSVILNSRYTKRLL